MRFSPVLPGGIGVYAVGPADQGYGLFVDGRIGFATRSGLATVKKGTKSVTIAGVSLTSLSSLVLATVQQAAPDVFVKAAEPDVVNSSITITLSRAPKVDVTVGWFVMN